MTVSTGQGLGFGKLLHFSNYSVLLSDSCSDRLPRATSVPHTSAVVETLASQLVKPRKIVRKKHRTKSQRFSGDEDDIINGENFWYYVQPGGGGGDGSDGGGIGFHGGSGGGSKWNSGGFGGQNWDDSSSRPSWGSRFAFDFFYEVVYWIAVSKCVHFALKRAGRAMPDAIGRGKVLIGLSAIC